MLEMDDETFEAIRAKTDEGNKYARKEDYKSALKVFIEALHLIPDPPEDDNATFRL